MTKKREIHDGGEPFICVCLLWLLNRNVLLMLLMMLLLLLLLVRVA